MEGRRQEMSEEQRKLAIDLYLRGEKQSDLADIFSVNKSTISRLVKKYNEGESLERSSNRGRKSLIDERGDRILIRTVKKNRRQTLSEIVDNFNEHAPQNVSLRTIQRRLHFHGINRHKVRKTLTVSDINRKRRIQWCKRMKNHEIDQYWRKVIFSDETQIVISNENRLYVWRTQDEAYRPECVGQHGRNVRISAMFWGCVTYSGVGTLVPVSGNMNSEKYIETLDENLWPVIVKHFGNSPFIFQDDNAPCHASQLTTAWKNANDLDCLDWPSQSPDINIIENIWLILKIRLRKSLTAIKTRDDLITEVLRIWSSLTVPYIRNLYHTIPRRLRAVIASKGHITKY